MGVDNNFHSASKRFFDPSFNPIALRKAKIVCNFGLSECNKVNRHTFRGSSSVIFGVHFEGKEFAAQIANSFSRE